MLYDMKQKAKKWSSKGVNMFRQGQCSHINCRSRLEIHNPVRDDIQAIIEQRLLSHAEKQPEQL